MIAPLAGERQPNETDRAVLACNDYLRMGPGRSLDKLCERYRQQNASEPSAPTRRSRTLYQWSTDFGWVERAQAYDAAQDASATVEAQRLRTEGLAADYERIRELSAIYAALRDEFRDGAGLWFKDIKLSAKGDTVEVDVFNKALIDSMRGVLDDLAKEVGGRKNEVKMSGGLQVEHMVKTVIDKVYGDNSD